jgi:hypothetical protein
LPVTGRTSVNLFGKHQHFRHAGLDPASSRRVSARRDESFQPKDLGWLDSGSGPE